MFRPTLLFAIAVVLAACGDSGSLSADDAGGSAEDTSSDVGSDGDGDASLDVDPQGDADVTPEETRSFRLGFTTWPYDLTVEAIVDTYDRILDHGDLVTHHIMGGVPWQESLDGDPFPVAIERDVCSRLQLTYPDAEIEPDGDGVCRAPTDSGPHAIYLAVDSLDTFRRDLAPYWNDAGENLDRADYGWGDAEFDDDDVIDAFSRFTVAMVERFRPAYVNYSSEVSDLMIEEPERFDAFLTFAEQVSQAIREAHPDVELMVSVALKHPDAETRATMAAGVARLAPYIDVLGISSYPYAFYGHANAGDPGALPDEWLEQAVSMADGLPLAITETGWIAENLDIEEYGLHVESTPTRQDAFVARLFEEAEALEVRFINWFTVVDYDALWEGIGRDPLAAIWRDSGLYGADLAPRPALQRWDAALALPLSR